MLNSSRRISKQNKKRWTEAMTSSTSDLVDAIYETLLNQKELCSVCKSVTEKINNLVPDYIYDPLWPPRQQNGADIRTAYTDGYRFLPPESIGVWEDIQLPEGVFLHHKEARTLLKTAPTCGLCTLIRLACVMDLSRERAYPTDRPTIPFQPLLIGMKLEDQGYGDLAVLREFRASTHPIYLQLVNVHSYETGWDPPTNPSLNIIRVMFQRETEYITEKSRGVVYAKLNVFDPSPGARSYIASRVPLRSSGSTDAFDIVKNWLHKCRKKHTWCKKTISRETIDENELHELPTRLLDVGNPGSNNEPRLVETNDNERGQWVALSHCWGAPENHPPKTTTENLAQHLKCIPCSTLPKTFVQAIILTRVLGFRYLWIDSLCILQNSHEDWANESKGMGLIYERAVLTIAASAAPDSTRGLFMPRTFASLKIPSVTLPLVPDGSQKPIGQFKIGMEWRQEPFVDPSNPVFSPLNMRGWATQEWILSRRIVHFLEETIVWVCREEAEDETGQAVIGPKVAEAEWCTEWGRIAQEHSARRFTYQTDRLVALHGLAREVGKTKASKTLNLATMEWGPWTSNPNYWFGIFENDMPEHLLWSPYVVGPNLSDFPSWSWASHSTVIYFRFREFDNDRQDEFVSACKILGCDTETGALRVASRRSRIDHLLNEPFAETKWDVTKGILYREPYLPGYFIGSKDEDDWGWIAFDSGCWPADTEEIFFLHLASPKYWKAPKVEYWGLVLIRDPVQTGCYRRVGHGAAYNISWLSEADVETVML